MRGRRGTVVLLAVLAVLVAGGAAWWWLASLPAAPRGPRPAPAPAPDVARGSREPRDRVRRPRRRVAARAERNGATLADEVPDGLRSDDPGAVSVTWTVSDEAGLPVVGVAVELRDAAGTILRTFLSDAEGRVEMGETLRDGVRLRIAAGGYDVLDVAAADVVDRVLGLRGSGRIVGRGVDDAGTGVDGADVVAVPEGVEVPEPLDGPGRPPWPLRATTGPGGTFLLERVPPHSMTLTATVAARGTRPAGRSEVGGIAVPASDVVLRLRRWPVVTGRVLDAAGQPLSPATVAMRARGPDGTGGRTWSTATASDGRFRFEDVTPGNTLWAWSSAQPGLAMAVLTDVPPGGAPLEIRLVPGGPVVARLVDSAGGPFTGAATFYVLDASGRIHNSAAASGGRVKTHVLAFDTRYDLLVYGAGGMSGRLDDVHAGARDLVVRLRPVAPIRGRVLGPGGEPAATGTKVRAVGVRASEYRRPGISLVTETDTQGLFTLGEIADLPFTIWAEPSGSGAMAAGPVVTGVLPGADVVLRLEPGVALSGRLVTSAGLPSSGRLWFVPDGDLPWHVEVTTIGDGVFVANGLHPGAYTVWLQVPPQRMVRLGVVRAPARGVELTLPER